MDDGLLLVQSASTARDLAAEARWCVFSLKGSAAEITVHEDSLKFYSLKLVEDARFQTEAQVFVETFTQFVSRRIDRGVETRPTRNRRPRRRESPKGLTREVARKRVGCSAGL